MSDIGPGDCVEANMDMHVEPHWVPYNAGPYDVAKGTRTIVVGLSPPTASFCPTCGERGLRGLLLSDYPLVNWVAWCPCEWRRVGGDKATHVKQFAEYIRERDGALIKALFPDPEERIAFHERDD